MKFSVGFSARSAVCFISPAPPAQAKSSLLAAWVLPRLERDGVTVIRLRGYQDPAQALEDELKRPGVIWKRNPPATTILNSLFEEARQRAGSSRILVVFDQFEEFLILQEEKQRTRFVDFLTAQARLPDAGSTILLVFRAEYDGFIQDLNLPAPVPGQNLQKVSAFTQRASQDFLLASGLKFQDQLLADVLREAAEVEETLGLIRPITLNLCGLVLSRFATGLPHLFRPGRLIRGFVHESIFQKEVREASPVLLPRLISHHSTKQPCSIDDLASGTSLTPRQAQGVMFKIGDPERGIVHALDPDYKVWEISHDFVVPMIDSMLAQWRVSLWKKVRPWLPLGYAAILLAALFVAPRLMPDPIGELNRLHWQTRLVDVNSPVDREFAKLGVKYVLTIKGFPPPESVYALKRIPGRFAVQLSSVDSFDSAHFGAWSDLTELASLEFRLSYSLKDISAAKGLRNLSWLDLSDKEQITDAGLLYLPGSLKTLDLQGDSQITDAGIKSLSALTSLTSLNLKGVEQITDAGLHYLPGSLKTLKLEGDSRITNAGLKTLSTLPSLTSLDLAHLRNITDAGLQELIPLRSLTTLELAGDWEITNAGLKTLSTLPSLTSLDLRGDDKITERRPQEPSVFRQCHR